MGFSTLTGGVSQEEIKELIDNALGETPFQLGNSTAGIIIHDGPGQTKNGVQVQEQYWVEIYGPAIHFSEI